MSEGGGSGLLNKFELSLGWKLFGKIGWSLA